MTDTTLKDDLTSTLLGFLDGSEIGGIRYHMAAMLLAAITKKMRVPAIDPLPEF